MNYNEGLASKPGSCCWNVTGELDHLGPLFGLFHNKLTETLGEKPTCSSEMEPQKSFRGRRAIHQPSDTGRMV
jgi:hypothetical protein